MTHSATPLIALDAVFLDTETTGLDPAQARLVQLGALRPRPGTAATDDQAAPMLDRLVDPGVPIPRSASAVHGIHDADVAGAGAFAKLAKELADFLGDAVLVGHTTSFDLEILRREHARAGLSWQPPRWLDVRLLARAAIPDLAGDDLDGLCARFGIAIGGRHTAIGDARAAAALFAALLPALRQHDIRTLGEAEAACLRLAERDARAGGALVLPSPDRPASAALSRIDSFPYRHRVSDVMSAPPRFTDADTRVAAALATLSQLGISSLIVRLAAGRHGIVTERDILRALAARGPAALDAPVADIASPGLETVAAADFIYRAIGRMTRLGFRHLGVRDAAGAIVGMLTPRNLLRQRASTALSLGDAIDSAADAGALGHAWGHLTAMARALLAEDVEAPDIAAVISEELRALTRRAAELAERRMAAEGHGPPPVPYCLLVLGSGGRGESLLAADQDNAIIFATGEPDGPEDRWFAAMATHMTATLDAVGVPFCKGGVMARNAPWRHSHEGWRQLIEHWLRRQKPQDLLNVDIFFDLTAVYGDMALAASLRDYAYAAARRARDFQVQLARCIGEVRAPLTLFGRIRADDAGRLDLKRHGLLPLVASARVLAIRHGLAAPESTQARWQALTACGVGAAEDIAAIQAAHATVLGAVLRQQLVDLESGVPPGSRVAVRGLTALERKALATALQQVETAVSLMNEGRI